MSTQRASPFCDYYNRSACSSCRWIETPYAEQLIRKESLLREALHFLPDLKLLPSVTSPELAFRNKAKMVVTGTSANPVIGITGTENLDHGQEILHCPIHHPKINELISAMPRYIREYNLIPYQIENRQGELKGLILFYAQNSKELYLRFVLRSQECVSRIRKLLPKILAEFPELQVVSANIQPVPHAILEGPQEIFLTEKNLITHRLGEFDLKLSPRAFVQTNVSVAEKLYGEAAAWVQEIHPKQMLELYCGQGAFSFFSANSAEQITGVEINEAAVKTANETARELGFKNLHFISGDAAKSFPASVPDLLLVNPPRKGLGSAGIALIEKTLPPYLLYSSCSVESLANDLKSLSLHYRVLKMKVFDLFPHTAHFETLVFLARPERGIFP